MKAKILFALAALLMLGSVSLNAQEVGNSSNSESTTQLEGDLNHDNKVDVADVTYLVNLIMKNQSEAKDGTYYWYIGVDNPTTISNIQTENTKAGWHDIGTSLSGFRLDTTGDISNRITLTESNTGVIGYYVIIPNELNIYDSNEDDGTYLFNEIQCNISGYKAFKYKSQNEIWTVKGIIIKENIPVSGVSISTSESSINVGNTLQLEATVEPSNATNQNVTWSSSNPEIATVDETTGLVTGVAVGSATITATSVDGGKTATTTVNVVETLSGYYWYIGTTLPSSISDIQTDPTKQGWHSIGTSLSGFMHDMNENTNRITLVERPTSWDDFVYYYVIIPNGITFRDAVGSNLKTNGEYDRVECNISGYEAYISTDTSSKVQGLIFEGPVD